MGLLVAQVIDDPHSMPKRQQVLTQVRTNKTATAGNQIAGHVMRSVVGYSAPCKTPAKTRRRSLAQAARSGAGRLAKCNAECLRPEANCMRATARLGARLACILRGAAQTRRSDDDAAAQ
jgi:hypothetical protein